MEPEKFLNGLKKAKKANKDLFIIYDNEGKHVINKIIALGDLEKAEIKGNAILFKEALLPQYLRYNTDQIKTVYVADEMI